MQPRGRRRLPARKPDKRCVSPENQRNHAISSISDQSNWMAHSINSCIAKGVNISAARLAVLEADKFKGFIDPAKFAEWASQEIADGTITLPTGAAAQFFGKCWGPALPTAGA